MDRSYLEMILLLAKPLRVDFDYPWSAVRLVFFGILPIPLLSLAAVFILGKESGDEAISKLLWNVFLITVSMALIIYITLAWHTGQALKELQKQKDRSLRAFRD